MTRRLALACVVAAVLLAPAGCGGRHTVSRDAEWERSWPALASKGPRWRAGAQIVVLTREGRPGGVRESRERWVLLRRDSLSGQFERRRDDGAAMVVAMRFHPPGATLVPGGGGASGQGRYAYATRFEDVRVPAGRFRCGRTWRDFEARDGAVMRVDEWWAPGIPVPVQSWTRWEGVVDTLYAPPRRTVDVRVGTEWAVLERLRQP